MLSFVKTRFRLIAGFALLALTLAVIPAASYALAGSPANPAPSAASGSSGKHTGSHIWSAFRPRLIRARLAAPRRLPRDRPETAYA